MTGSKGEYGDEFDKVSGDVWNILIDKAEMEAYDKIKMVPKGQGSCLWSFVPLVHRCVRVGLGGAGPDAHAPDPAQAG